MTSRLGIPSLLKDELWVVLIHLLQTLTVAKRGTRQCPQFRATDNPYYRE